MPNKYPCPRPDTYQIIGRLSSIRDDMLEKERTSPFLDRVHPNHRNSARNLIQYLALRSHDIRVPQVLLTDLGLSSLGRAERKVQATVDSVLVALHQISGSEWDTDSNPPVCFREGRQLLEDNTVAIVGPPPSGRRVRIMLTMPTEAAYQYDLVKDLVRNGMNCARINCAHDNPDVWGRMIANIRKAAEVTGTHCLVHMDLGGPKLRTGLLEDGPRVQKVRPVRNDLGIVRRPSGIFLYSPDLSSDIPTGLDACIQVDRELVGQCKPGDKLYLEDARGSNRYLTVTELRDNGLFVQAEKTIYFTPGLSIIKLKADGKLSKVSGKVGDMPPKENFLHINKGDLLELHRDLGNGRPGFRDEYGQWNPPVIGCTLSEVFDQVKVGEPIWFDDGKFGGIIESVEDGVIRVRIEYARPKGVRLRAGKGINLPESDLDLSALTGQDLKDLPFVLANADSVGLSFANSARDVDDLIREMKKWVRESERDDLVSEDRLPGIVIKIETRAGFDNLPEILLTAMQMPKTGVMIARGDLAIECGFGRLAEVQEQILWVCEAAHVPVIWATQVLEGLAKDGMPTRSEITDAAMGQRAECIMLNKGEHIVLATKALDDILRRMQDHMTKKRSLFRKLHLAERFFRKPVPMAT